MQSLEYKVAPPKVRALLAVQREPDAWSSTPAVHGLAPAEQYARQRSPRVCRARVDRATADASSPSYSAS